MTRRAAGAAVLLMSASVVTATASPPTPPQEVPTSLFKDVPYVGDELSPRPRPTPFLLETIARPPAPPARPAVDVPPPHLIVLRRSETPAKAAPAVRGRHALVGRASWYCLAGQSSCMARHPDTAGFDKYAAAGPRLRVAMGGGAATTAPDPWRGRIVTVSANGRSVRVRLADFCQCYFRQPNEKVIDLYHDVWVYLGVPDGSNKVTIRW